ncbi:hypothetical protein CRE_04194 [Caenorhabditis remanei]|uniref:F-box domain-containing protein n=1 Tax=Caenorhabditis remanei TaxID=31234 RepID=E3MYY2_CAERE|nr:hypothetical protein CRE_04194 [Caenorhabditis remanei]
MTEVSKPLPLFRLPAIPLTKISRYMNLQEILLVSLTSKKSAFIMRSLLPTNRFFLNIKISEESNIFLGVKGPWAPVIVKGEKTEDVFELQIAQHNGDVIHRWTSLDLEAIVKSLLSHFALVFNPSISIHFEEVFSEEFMMGVMDHVKQLNLVKKSIKLSSFPMSSENYRYILDECRAVSELWLFCKVESDFEYRAGPDFRIDYLHVSDGHWMHLDDFSNCKKVKVFDRSEHKQPKYANLEVPRALIRKWIESEGRLENLEVHGGRGGINQRKVYFEMNETPGCFKATSIPYTFDFKLMFKGLELRTTEQTVNSHSVEIIRRCDGKKATVTCGWNYFELKVID